MTLRTVRAAGRLAERYGGHLFIGGGEPTLHPRFWEIVGLVMGYNADRNDPPNGTYAVELITNGSQTEDALKLARLAAEGLIYCGLSRDQYHDPIDPAVTQAFRRTGTSTHDGRDLREGTIRHVWATGRGRKIEGAMDGCDQCGLLISPDGSIWRCNCQRERLGSVHNRKIRFDPDLITEGELVGCSTLHGRLVERNGVLVTRLNAAELDNK